MEKFTLSPVPTYTIIKQEKRPELNLETGRTETSKILPSCKIVDRWYSTDRLDREDTHWESVILKI